MIDPVSTTIGGTVSAGLFDNLPVQRNYQSIATLLPGVSMSFLGDGLHIGGATGLENRYFVDGIEMTDPARGMGGTQLPPDFIREVQVKTGGYEAEYRSALGGVVNVVTPSGSNEFAGKFIGYWTSHAVSGDPKQSSLELQTKGFAQYDAGFSLSGPSSGTARGFSSPTIPSTRQLIPRFRGSATTTARRRRIALQGRWTGR